MSEQQTSKEAVQESILAHLNAFTILRDLLRNIPFILLAGLTGALIVMAIPYFAYKPVYTSTATLMVTGSVTSNSSFSTYSSNARSLCDILTDEYILQEVAEDMGLQKVDASVSAEVVSDTNLITLSVASGMPTTSYRVLKGLLEHYTDISDMMYPGYYLYTLVPAAYPSGASNYYDVSGLRKKVFLLCMAVCAAVVILLSVFYDSVKGESDVEKKLDTRLYGAVYHERKYKTLGQLFNRKKWRKNAVLVNSPLSSFGFVENNRRMREKFVSRTQESKKNTLLITSMLENEGKSTVAANFAIGLAGLNKRVVILDADLRKPAQYKVLDMTQNAKAPLSEYLRKNAKLEDLLCYDEKNGLTIIGNVQSDKFSSEIISTDRMKTLIDRLKKDFDYVVIDTPPMEMVADAEMMAAHSDYTLLVICPDNAPAAAVNDCIDRLNNCNAKLLGCILNNIYTVSLLIEQITGVNVSSIFSAGYGSKQGYGHYGSYSYGYGYGRNASYGNGNKKVKTQADTTEEKQETGGHTDFFDTVISEQQAVSKEEADSAWESTNGEEA